METKLEINSLESLREAVLQQIHVLELRVENEDGFVIAGYGGKTLYSYVGSGMGYMGACLSPSSCNPMVFDDKDRAWSLASSMNYKNGNNERIELKVWNAVYYYASIINYLNNTLKTIDSL